MSKIPAKYQFLLHVMRQTLTECGGELGYKPEDFGLNDTHKSEEGVRLVMDYGSPQSVRTPDGSLTPYGSHRPATDQDRFLALLKVRLGLREVVPQRDDAQTDPLSYQTSTSGPIFAVTKCLDQDITDKNPTEIAQMVKQLSAFDPFEL
jgi:hypothetical protein